MLHVTPAPPPELVDVRMDVDVSEERVAAGVGVGRVRLGVGRVDEDVRRVAVDVKTIALVDAAAWEGRPRPF